MPIFEKPPLDTLAPARERWTPIYLEHGRLEVDDSSVKWIGADYQVFRIPAATLSAILLGPGTTVTHAAMKACADSNTPVCWIGEDGLRFYASGVSTNHDPENARRQAEAHASKTRRLEIARKMFQKRFPGEDVSSKTLQELRGMEGYRVRALYREMGNRHGVTWKGRNYDPGNWDLADEINQAVSAANAGLYALCSSVICSMGFLPQLGFVHNRGMLPFVFDMADLFKPETTLEAAFQAVSLDRWAKTEDVLALLKTKIEETRLLSRLTTALETLFT